MAKKTRSRKPARRKTTPARKPRAKKPSGGSDPRLNGWITHTEFASSDPGALKTWLSRVLGWKFGPPMPMPDGNEYLLFMYSQMGGGGIRPTERGEDACTVPYVQVANVKAAYKKALAAGAEGMIEPARITEDVVIACVRAPGGVAIGLAGPR